MEKLVGKKRNVVNQSLFSRNFEGGVVGLGIVAAMTDSLSRPIPIIKGGAGMVDELSESYTCVISHIGNSSVKRVLVDDCSVVAAMFSASPLNLGGEVRTGTGTEFGAGDFLSCCYLCNKQLHGLDIFMYRGEKAFCSSDCRDKHIRSDKRKEKCRSEAVEYSVSPCSGPMLFSAGVAAA